MTDDEQAQAVLEMLVCRKWSYVIAANDTRIINEFEILKAYYPRWRDQMYRSLRQDEVSPEECIQDIVSILGAKEI